MKFPYLLFTVVIGIVIGVFLEKIFSHDKLDEGIKKLNDVLSITEKYYLEDVDTQKLIESAITGILNELDPHSVYIPPKDLAQVEETMQGDFDGIGIEFQIVNDTLTVVSPITGGPSEALGIQAGDRIIRIDNVNVIGIKNEGVFKKLRGKKGSEVRVSIIRNGSNKINEYTIVRDKIPLYSVDTHFMIDNNTGYLSVSRFAETTYDEILKSLDDLYQKGMKQLVFDLRGNPGGYLNQAVSVSDLFISGKKKIVYTQGRIKEFDEVYFASKISNYENIPLIILINKGSASASEIVSGAIQDWDRGLIVGETSFGKGLVQKQFDLSDNSALRLTVSQYFTPSGRLIQRNYKNLKDKKTYYSEIMEQDSVEGENINHKAEQDSVRPEFKTGKGRVVYGGGGITPDYIVKSELMTNYTQNLLRNNLFYIFVLSFLDNNSQSIKSKYKDDLNYFKDDFKISDELLNRFIEYAKSNNVPYKSEEFEKDKEYISIRLKAQIARNFWKNEGWYSILLTHDHQFTKAITLFNEAKKLANLK
jgi:carboxyl-terminal processing protease